MATPVNTQPVPPVPSAQDIDNEGGKISQPWSQWFINLRDKVNIINSTVAALANVTLTPDGALPISSGGTGQVTASAAFQALSPLTTNGDMLIYNSGNIRLPIGTSGQILAVQSGIPTWVNPSAGSTPLTTKGDIYGFDVGPARIPVGTNSYVLTADSTVPLGVSWKPAGTPTLPVTTKGDLLGYDTAANRVPIGTNGSILIADSTQPLGLRWGTYPVTTKGDIFTYGTVPSRLAVGTDGQVLVARSSAANGIDWETISGGASVGTYASLPGTVTNGNIYQCSDCPLKFIGSSGVWTPFHGDYPIGLPTGLSTWVNQGTATLTNFGPFQNIFAPTDGGTVTARIRAKTLAHSSNYTVTFLLESPNIPTQFGLYGIVLYDSVGGGYVFLGIAGRESTTSGGTAVSQTINVSKFTSVTTFNSDYIQYPYPNPGKIWLRFVDDGTNRKSFISQDGFNFLQIHSVGRTDFLTPNSVGFLAMANSTVFGVSTSCISFTETTP